jgi:hypothetical protein
MDAENAGKITGNILLLLLGLFVVSKLLKKKK